MTSMGHECFVRVINGQAIPWADIPELPLELFRAAVIAEVDSGHRLVCLGADHDLSAYVVLADDASQQLLIARTVLTERYDALTPACPQAHLFEREIAEQFALEPLDHPWLKPVRHHAPWRRGAAVFTAEDQQPGQMDFFRIDGQDTHEVAVGPVHAGVIEPGHFRFQCHGETVMHLEIALGYQHRGITKGLVGGPHPRSLKHAETMAGDTTIGHAWAYCQALEGLARTTVSERADLIRGIALELERLANHTGDLGAIANDVGFLPTASFCGRIRGDWLNLSAFICGSRLGRDLLKPGGVRFDLSAEQLGEFRRRVETSHAEVIDAVDLLWTSSSVMARLEGTGVLEQRYALDLGVVGVAARACGLKRDIRADQPFGPWRRQPMVALCSEGGDVLARARVRALEIPNSVAWILAACERLAALPKESRPVALTPLATNHFCCSLVEGWRGEICHVAMTDDAGRFRRYHVVDPSFHNWYGLAVAMRGETISDFPLCNKSFNLSYCGFDL